jgi:hypothetical protein
VVEDQVDGDAAENAAAVEHADRSDAVDGRGDGADVHAGRVNRGTGLVLQQLGEGGAITRAERALNGRVRGEPLGGQRGCVESPRVHGDRTPQRRFESRIRSSGLAPGCERVVTVECDRERE